MRPPFPPCAAEQVSEDVKKALTTEQSQFSEEVLRFLNKFAVIVNLRSKAVQDLTGRSPARPVSLPCAPQRREGAAKHPGRRAVFRQSSPPRPLSLPRPPRPPRPPCAVPALSLSPRPGQASLARAFAACFTLLPAL